MRFEILYDGIGFSLNSSQEDKELLIKELKKAIKRIKQLEGGKKT